MCLPRLKTLATRARDVGNTLHLLSGNKAGSQYIPEMATATVVVVVAEKFWLVLIAHKKHVIKNHNVRFDGFALALPFSSNSSTSFWKLLMPMGNILMAGYARGLQEHLPRGWQHGQSVPALDNFRISSAHNWQGSLSPKNKILKHKLSC